jgi:hypothetical protein
MWLRCRDVADEFVFSVHPNLTRRARPPAQVRRRGAAHDFLARQIGAPRTAVTLAALDEAERLDQALRRAFARRASTDEPNDLAADATWRSA